MNSVLQAEMRCQRREIISIMIHVMAIGDLTGPAVTAAVMRDDAIPAIDKKHHLSVPIVGRQRPSVAENDGLSLAPIFVEDLRTVLSRDRTHRLLSLNEV